MANAKTANAKKTAAQGSNDVAMVKKDSVVDLVTKKVQEFVSRGELHLPPDYSAHNAMKAAWLVLQETKDKNGRPALEVCTKNSIANALLDMVVQGLNPAKKQCYFIVYGNKLICQRSYFGSMAVCKQAAGAKEIYAEVVYEGDEFEYEIRKGRRYVRKHVQKLDNIDSKKIVAAYCIVEFGDERPDYCEIMSIDQIKKAWAQGQLYKEGGNGTHQKFTDQMCKKTVINRACKAFINSSSDSHLLLEAFNRADDEKVEQEVAEEIEENANSEFIDIEGDVQEDEPEIEIEEPGEPEEIEAELVVEQKEKQEPKQKPKNKQIGFAEGPGF